MLVLGKPLIGHHSPQYLLSTTTLQQHRLYSRHDHSKWLITSETRENRHAKRQRNASFTQRCQHEHDLEKAIQHGLDAQDLKVAAKKLQEFDESNQKFEELANAVREGLGGTSIYLVGMMGSGKSTVGKIVADALDYPLLDSDEVIEEYEECSIAEIFEREGEEEFRAIESSVLQEMMPFKACVISTGGGVVERRKNWGYMQHGIVVWLDGPPELLARRACKDDQNTRPLLGISDQSLEKDQQLESTTAKLVEILDRRKDQYAQADLRISLTHKGNPMGATLPQVANRLLEAIHERLEADKGHKAKKPPKDFKGFGPSH